MSAPAVPATLAWFARHECRLAWRDWLHMMTAGRLSRLRWAAVGALLFAAFLHWIADLLVGGYADLSANATPATLLIVTANGFLFGCLLLSQAMESVTRAFYSRADLDLILSSPASARRLFSVRIAAMALAVAAMAALMAAPLINMLAWRGGAHWLGAYGVIVAMGMGATALAAALTVALFRLIGPKRTRLVAQVVAAVIGAAFVIGLQAAAILSTGSLSRLDLLTSERVLALAPAVDSPIWLPARAMMGDGPALAGAMIAGAALLAAAIAAFAPRFGEHVIAAAGVGRGVARQDGGARFRRVSPPQALRRKEWALLRRDPWLMSQTLMQLLYLLPPALLLWKSFAGGIDATALLVPMLIMAAGQLAGGLAWLAISGEDAPDLIASAPVTARRVTRAKIEAVMGAVGLVFAPLVTALALVAPQAALAAAVFIVVAAASSTAIQLWFRSQAKRSHFRRRQTSSRVATFAEALVSVGWAGTGALVAMGNWLAAITAVIVLLILLGTRLLSPARAAARSR